MSDRDVVITGLGPVTSIGVGQEAFWDSLVEGRSQVATRALPVDVAASVELPVAAIENHAAIPNFDKHEVQLAEQGCERHRDLCYALAAIELAIADAGLARNRDRDDIGVIQVFEAPGVERTVCRLFALMSGGPPPDGPPAVYDLLAPHFYNMQGFLYVHLVGKVLGLHGFSTSVHNACSSGAFAMELAADRIRTGKAEVMIVAGGEAFDTGVRLEWFRRLQLYATGKSMRPFDREPSGFYVGEGGAAMVMESAAHAHSRGAKPYAKYLGGAFAHQGWKQTIPDVRAARLRGVIQSALKQTKVSWEGIDLIVPHGAATSLSDGYERECLAAALADAAPSCTAVAAAFKPAVGHLLAASGLIEVIAMLLAMKHGVVPGRSFAGPADTRFPIPFLPRAEERPVRAALKLSTGFTGHDAAAVFLR